MRQTGGRGGGGGGGRGEGGGLLCSSVVKEEGRVYAIPALSFGEAIYYISLSSFFFSGKRHAPYFFIFLLIN